MQLAMVGLGRMGSNMVRRLLRGGHECVVFDAAAAPRDALAKEGARPVGALDALPGALKPRRVVWVMLPSGAVTEQTVTWLGEHLESGDVVIDGGNSFYKDDVRRGEALAKKGIQYVDVGTSGGVWGAERGYCLMYGGAPEAVAYVEPILRTLAPGKGTIPETPGRKGAGSADQGYLHCGPVGAGHFVKMIHNGIEYGLMQAFAEGFDILKNATSENLPENLRYDLPLGDIAELWRRGSVVSSWLLDLTAIALAADPVLAEFSGVVADSGEGRWTLQAAMEEAVPANVLSAALYARFRSRQEHGFGDKLLSAMRKQFGGHVEAPQATVQAKPK